VNHTFPVRGGLLARNAFLNLVGQALPLLVAVATIPVIVRGLGTERFGILSLAWVSLGQFALFDLGLGRATTKFVAEALSTGDEDQVGRLVWTTVTTQFVLGLFGAFLMVGVTPLVVEHVLNIPPALVGETKLTFYLLALSVPVVLVSSSLSGVLEADQRFDLVNAVKVPSSIATVLLPLVGVRMGLQLPGILGLLLFARAAALLALAVLDLWVFPKLKKPLLLGLEASYALFHFGGWVMVSNILLPVLRYLDRFMIGAVLSVPAVAYYSVSFDIMDRLWIIPSSLALTIFPAVSALSASNQHARTQALFECSVKFLLVVTAPLIIVLIAFAGTLLRAWLGPEFAQHGTTAFQVLAAGAAIGLMAPISGSVLQGYGRPDILAKLYILYIPANIVLVWVLVRTLGIPGAALSAAVRTVIDACVLLFIACRMIHLSPLRFLKNLSGPLASVCGFGLLSWMALWTSEVLLVQVILMCTITSLFAGTVWRWIMSDEDKRTVRSLLTRE
jgi:O-antigen/teichoic acid export membrane protein